MKHLGAMLVLLVAAGAWYAMGGGTKKGENFGGATGLERRLEMAQQEALRAGLVLREREEA